MLIKCKMCGGDLRPAENATTCECEYCGSVQTIPKLDNERRLNLYDRANHFRRNNEYDKAMGIFEQILQDDRTDAEAYWSLVLCRYGIEYVEDPATKKRIPTVNRAQFTSIFSDDDYKSALQYADGVQKGIYETEAKAIDDIQKGILDISRKEKPFDVFICYKETDAQGKRTPDSVLANDLYHQLTREGFKVFFSRITLEDKLGQQYEPYIFAALNSAKVMVVLGTKPEYFNAVWVKNEWSRYLKLIKGGANKTLVPAYKDMDPYDLPEEFSHLQAQDMSKLGFVQDLIHGIRKIAGEGKPEQPKAAQHMAQAGAPAADASPTIANLLKRAALFLEDGDFRQANEYLDRVLDLDVECAPAYAAKVCVAFGLCRESALADTPFQYEDNADWKKALRFANAQQKATYEGYAAKVKERVAVQIRNYAYDCAVEMAVKASADRSKLDSELAAYKTSCTRSNGSRANGSRRQNSQLNENAFKQAVSTNEPGDVSEQGLKTAADMFEAIKDSEAVECARQCRTLAEQARQKLIYTNAVAAHDDACNKPAALEQVANIFLTVPQYKDARDQARKCMDEAEDVRRTRYDYAIKAMEDAGDSSKKWEQVKNDLADSELDNYRDVASLWEQAAKRYDECLAAEKEAQRQKEEKARCEAEAAAAKQKRTTILGIVAVLVIAVSIYVVTQIIIPGNNYNNAVQLMADGKYQEASDAFAALGGYKDAAARVNEPFYEQGKALMSAGHYEEAIAAFEKANGFGNSAAQITACRTAINDREYAAAVALMNEGKYTEAIVAFEKLDGYKDSATQIKEAKYQQAGALNASGKYAEAYALYATISGYKDVNSLLVNDHNLAATAAREPYTKVGNVVTYGHYEQDNNSGNGKEAIEWIVLKYDNASGKSLLLSRYGLDAHRFDASYYQGWDESEMRSWLNITFLNNAFTAKEQEGIVTTKVSTPSYGRKSGGSDTQDRLWLLSRDEAETFFGNNEARKAIPTKYAVAQGADQSRYEKLNGTGCCWWWLR